LKKKLKNQETGSDARKALEELRLEKKQSHIEPIPLVPNTRNVGDLKSLYDTTIQTHRIHALIEAGRLKAPENKIFIDRIFRSEDEIIGALLNSISYLQENLPEGHHSKEDIERGDMPDKEFIEHLTHVEKELIGTFETMEGK